MMMCGAEIGADCKPRHGMFRGTFFAAKQELIDRIHQYLEEVNAAPLVFPRKYKMTRLADLAPLR